MKKEIMMKVKEEVLKMGFVEKDEGFEKDNKRVVFYWGLEIIEGYIWNGKVWEGDICNGIWGKDEDVDKVMNFIREGEMEKVFEELKKMGFVEVDGNVEGVREFKKGRLDVVYDLDMDVGCVEWGSGYKELFKDWDEIWDRLCEESDDEGWWIEKIDKIEREYDRVFGISKDWLDNIEIEWLDDVFGDEVYFEIYKMIMKEIKKMREIWFDIREVKREDGEIYYESGDMEFKRGDEVLEEWKRFEEEELNVKWNELIK